MKCFSCSAKLEEGFTTHAVEIDSSVIVVRHVPCLKCTECGEIFYDDDTMDALESIIRAARKMAGDIFVVEYKKAA